MVGSLFSSDAWNSVTFAAAEVEESLAEPAAGAGARHGTRLAALRPRERLVPERAAVSGDADGGDRRGAGNQSRDAGSRGHGRGRDHLRAERRAAHGRRHSDLDVRLQQRIDPVGRASVLRHGPRWPVLPAGGDVELEQRPRLRVGGAVDLDGHPLPDGDLRTAAELRDLRGAAVLCLHDDRAVHPSREAAGCASAVPRVRLSRPAGAVHRALLRSDAAAPPVAHDTDRVDLRSRARAHRDPGVLCSGAASNAPP